MAIKYKIYQSDYPYHIYNRTNNKEYLLTIPTAFPVFMNVLKYCAQRTDFRPHHVVLMSNHFHLIGSTPKSNLNQFMCLFQTLFSTKINEISGRTNHIFGSRYGATVVASELYISHLIRYVYQNPVVAGLSSSATSYRYSSLNHYISDTHSHWNLEYDPYLNSFHDHHRVSELLRLSSLSLKKSDADYIQTRLKKKYFVIDNIQ